MPIPSYLTYEKLLKTMCFLSSFLLNYSLLSNNHVNFRSHIFLLPWTYPLWSSYKITLPGCYVTCYLTSSNMPKFLLPAAFVLAAITACSPLVSIFIFTWLLTVTQVSTYILLFKEDFSCISKQNSYSIPATTTINPMYFYLVQTLCYLILLNILSRLILWRHYLTRWMLLSSVYGTWIFNQCLLKKYLKVKKWVN